MTVCDIIAEPMRIHHIAPPRGTYRKEAEFQMYYVGLRQNLSRQVPVRALRRAAPARRHRTGAVHGAGASGGGRTDRVAGCVHSGTDRQPVPPFAATSTAFRSSSSRTTLRWCDSSATASAYCYHGKLVEVAPVARAVTTIRSTPIPRRCSRPCRFLIRASNETAYCRSFSPGQFPLTGELIEAEPDHFVLHGRGRATEKTIENACISAKRRWRFF